MRRHVRRGIVVLGVVGVVMGGAGVASARPLPQPPGHTLTVTEAGTGSGSVTSGDGAISCPKVCNNFYTSTAPVTLTATAAAGSTFAGWGGDCTGTAPTCTVPMISNHAVSATFTGSSSGPPPPVAPTCSLRIPSSRVLLKAPKAHPAQARKVGRLSAVFGCDQAVAVKLVIKVVETVPGTHHHKGHKTTFTRTTTFSLSANHRTTLTLRLWSGAMRGLAKRYHETYKVTLSAGNANGRDVIVRAGSLHGTG
jgi:hypothetical protein